MSRKTARIIFALFGLSVFFINIGKAQSDASEVIVRPLSKFLRKDSFPLAWFGNWEGTLEIHNDKGLSQKVPMELVIGATDTNGVYQWNIVYGTDREKGLRPYILRTIDAKKGLFVCDELNGIKLESYLLGGRLFSTYIVEGNLLTTIFEKRGETITFDIIFGKEKPVSTTGDATAGNEKIPMVRTMPVMVSQRAVLARKKQ